METKDYHASDRVWTSYSDDGHYPQGISGCSVLFLLRLQEIFEAGPALRLAEDGCFQNLIVRLRNEKEGLFRAGDSCIDKFTRHNRIVM